MKKIFICIVCLFYLHNLCLAIVIINSISGTAFVNDIPATVGQQLNQDDIIKTEENAAVVVLINNHKVTISEKTEIAIFELSDDVSVLNIVIGKIHTVVKKLKPRQKFEIKTPTAICAVRGTEFMIEVFSDGRTVAEVYKGLIGVRNIEGIGDEVAIYENQRSEILINSAPSRPEQLKTEIQRERELEKSEIKKEVGLQMTKEQVQTAAAEELRLAEYQEGKTLIDVFGKRVRLEEYIMRPANDQFKLVVLNERADRFDYFYYKGTFNKDLPEDLSIALKDIQGKVDTEPDYFLTGYQTGRSNTIDKIEEVASGGHLVNVNKNTDAKNITITDDDVTTIYDSDTDRFSDITGRDYYKSLFDNYTYKINDIEKICWEPKPGIINIQSSNDLIYRYAGGTFTSAEEWPSGAGFLHHRINIFYGDGTWEKWNNYIISDEGKLASTDDFNRLVSGKEYLQELLKWNYQQVVTATEFGDRKIDLVVEPKIFIKSGLIK